jgi:arylsulfatase A-like enzyme
VTLLLAAPHAGGTSPRRGAPAPNIVLVMTDDQALSQVGPEYMPTVTRLLAGQGTTFENAFLTTPLCCPSRAGLLTGQYGHNNGVLTSSYGYLRDKGNVLPVWLRRAGYVTAHVGKFLNRYHQRDRQAAVAGMGPVVHGARREPGHLLRLGPFEERPQDPLRQRAEGLRAARIRAQRDASRSQVRAPPQTHLP